MPIDWEKLDALLFDFGGTLDQPGRHWLDRFLAHYLTIGIDLSREELDPAYSHATQRGYQAGERLYEVGLRSLVAQLVDWQFDYLLERMPDRLPHHPQAAARRIANQFCAESDAGLADSRSVLAVLAKRFQIGVVSNFYGNLETVLREAGVLRFVTAVIDSSRVGVFKPDPAIYLTALTGLGSAPQRTAMIGDSLGKDCAPARRLGLRTVWLAGPSIRYTQPVEACADQIARDLHELVEICLGTNRRGDFGGGAR